MKADISSSEARAREIEAVIRRRLTGKATKVAEVLGWSDSTMSRWKERYLPEVSAIIAALDLEFSDPADGVTISREEYRVLRALAEHGKAGFLDSLPSV